MNNRKKFKQLLNSIPNGSAVSGALQKISETFLEDVEEKVKALTPNFGEIGSKVDQLTKELEESFTSVEKRFEKVRDGLKAIEDRKLSDISAKVKEVRKLIETGQNKLEEIERKFKDINSIIETGQGEVGDLIVKAVNKIQFEKNNLIKNIIEEVGNLKSDLITDISKWESSLSDKMKNFDTDFTKYIEEKGLDLFINYIRNNAYKIIWSIFLGLFKKAKKNKK